MECSVCCETINKKNTKVVCKYCDYVSCKSCSSLYVLNQLENIHCMNTKCEKRTWDREFMIQELGYGFVDNKYKKHRGDILFDLEKAKIPIALEYIENQRQEKLINDQLQPLIENRKRIKREIKEIVNRKKEVCDKLFTKHFSSSFFENYEHTTRIDPIPYCSNPVLEKTEEYRIRKKLNLNYYEEDRCCDYSVCDIHIHKKSVKNRSYFDEIKQIFIDDKNLKKELKEADKEFRETRESLIHPFVYGIYQNAVQAELNKKPEKEPVQKFFGHCPITTCKGLINSMNMCAICEIIVCRDCKEELTDDISHYCNEDTLASIKEIRKNSKPCPRCKVPIIKISGCNQFFCTICHLTYDYRTLREIKNCHNPHYFEFKLKQLKNSGDANEVDICNISQWQYESYGNHRIQNNIQNSMLRELFHVIWMMSSKVRSRVSKYNSLLESDYNLMIRIKYVKNELSEKDFRSKLYQKEKYISKIRDFLGIYQTYMNTFDNYTKVLYVQTRSNNEIISKNQLCNYFEITLELIKYVNNSFCSLMTIYRNSVPQIDLNKSKDNKLYCKLVTTKYDKECKSSIKNIELNISNQVFK